MKIKLNKTLIARVLLILTGMCGLSSCADELLYDDNAGNGEMVEMSVGVSLPDTEAKDVLTRAADGKLPLQIYDLMVFAFDSKGEIAQRYFFSNLKEGMNECDAQWSSDATARLQADETASHVSLLNMRVPSGKGYLMAIANVEIMSTTLLGRLKNITSRKELLELRTPYLHYDSNASILSGAYMENGSVGIDSFNPNGDIVFRSGSMSGKIYLLSTAASIQFNVNGQGSGSKGGVFTLESYELVNLPSSTPLIAKAEGMSESETPVSTGEIEVFEELNSHTYSFSYEQLEYLGKGSGIESYERRADWNHEASPDNGYKVFTNAPQTAPYVIIRGKYSGNSAYVDENGNDKVGNVEASVAYYILLGHDSATNPNDFDTRRNWEYVYNISVNGIKDITVEVNRKDNTVRQDAEGDVIVMDSNALHRFDSHYCQMNFSMTVKEIRALAKGGKLGFRVQAPAYGVDATMMLKQTTPDSYDYENENSEGWGVYDDNGNLLTGSTNYHKKKGNMDLNNLACVAADWLRFYQHDANIKQGSYDEVSSPWIINYTDKLFEVNSQNNPQLLTIYRFLWKLNAIAKNDNYKDSDEFTFTVFVQENHYENNWNDRMVKSHGTTGKSGDIHWSQFVNVDDRKVMLFPDTKVSEDGASTFSNPRRVFAQRSIRTIYKPRYDKNYKAWGTESKEEFFHNTVTNSAYPAWFTNLEGIKENWSQVQRMLPIAKLDKTKVNPKVYLERVKDMGFTRSDHGREACFDELKGKEWTDYLTLTNKPLNYENGKPGDMNYRLSGHLTLNSNGVTKANMISACLARNRDLNGNGKIDADEIRWYVPGIRQLQALFVGNAGLPTEARLYQKEANEGKWVYKHYMSATRREGDESNAVLWAEEGISTGQMTKSYAYGVHVRCVRDLGTDLKQRADTWSDSFKIFKTGTGNAAGYVDIDNFNSNSVRYALENKDLSGIVTTFSNSNRPAQSFYYANKIINTGATKTFNYDGTVHIVPDWESKELVRIGEENKKSETSPQRRSLCGEHFGQGWRTPTITELAILYWSDIFSRSDNVMSRTRYVYWNVDGSMKYGSDIITGISNDANGRDPHSFCENEFRLRIPWEKVKLPTATSKNQMDQVNGHYGGILCVKDKF